MDLTDDQYDVLRAINDLQADPDDAWPSTVDVGSRLLEIYKSRGGGYSWHASPPWHGTNPSAEELPALDMIEVEVGMASFHQRGEPTPSVDRYWLGLTTAGRKTLAEHEAGT